MSANRQCRGVDRSWVVTTGGSHPRRLAWEAPHLRVLQRLRAVGQQCAAGDLEQGRPPGLEVGSRAAVEQRVLIRPRRQAVVENRPGQRDLEREAVDRAKLPAALTGFEERVDAAKD